MRISKRTANFIFWLSVIVIGISFAYRMYSACSFGSCLSAFMFDNYMSSNIQVFFGFPFFHIGGIIGMFLFLIGLKYGDII